MSWPWFRILGCLYGLGFRGLPIGSIVVPFCGSYLGSYKVVPKKELRWGLGVGIRGFKEVQGFGARGLSALGSSPETPISLN